MNKTLLLIDPQNDFMDLDKSTLPVSGSTNDMLRVINVLKNEEFDNVVVTLDQHNVFDIAHPTFWLNKEGQHPEPFTKISLEDFENKTWLPVNKELIEHCSNYLKILKKQAKYDLIIWPEHCLINTWGSEVFEPLLKELKIWEVKSENSVSYITKGENPLTEHYSAMKAEVVLLEDANTDNNLELLELIVKSTEVHIAGEAFTHCVYSTVKDIIEYLNENDLDKPLFILYENATSPVFGFESKVDSLSKELKDLGVIFKHI